MVDTRTHVVVIGGGYAGTVAANRVRLADDVDVTLVNPRPQFVERIRLHQLVAGSDDAVVDYSEVLGEGIDLVTDRASRIDAAARIVVLDSGDTLDYDYLIYAVGSGVAAPTVPGAAEFAYPMAEFEYATRLRAALDDVGPATPITVVGAGSTGIETAAELAELGHPITLVCGGVLGPYLSPAARRSAARRLARMGVNVLDGPAATVTAVTRHAVTLADGREVPSPITVWTAGFGVPDLAAKSGLSTDSLGRLITDETLTSVDDDRIVAAGDAAAPSDQPLRMCCASAAPLGAQAADTVRSRIAGTAPAPLNVALAGQCISLGSKAGVFQLSHTDDTATPLYVGGRAGAALKKAALNASVTLLAREARKPGSLIWLKSAKRGKRLADGEKVSAP
ncbi:FAD-dependent oxidoreductase [Mycolicibacterium pulveris]|uniref:NADH dehydrogenase n=1 Tax=Mycolicibacterium pulveris TaxID=36813 RepID=A0A7I7UNN4_MYCPV|nr:FAD-dependent oxidoreductase [Mycolicibacterium pulveris]MCV6981391.1 FAD-dependent oxidoreductase [Mycolicibacterium pulveris]BBY82159.1 NADH dehydrogenase [Mycolicibacterium pulveris]